jgi:hypothetical protein
MVESRVQPNAVEGSVASSPMRARDYTRQMRTFTAEEIRDRRVDRKGRALSGPLLAGIGLTQFTSKDQRAGLFTYKYQGRVLGTAILNNPDAQVDYLVSLLQGTKLDKTLRTPGITVDQAVDAFVYDYERPGAILAKNAKGKLYRLPWANPAVQGVFGERDAYGQRALQTYQNSRHSP